MDLGEKINPITKLQIKEIELRNGEREYLSKFLEQFIPPEKTHFY